MTCSENLFQFFQLLNLQLPNTNFIPRGALRLCCAHIAQLMTHTTNLHMVVYLAIMSLKPLDILQMVTKSQKLYHISNKGNKCKPMWPMQVS